MSDLEFNNIKQTSILPFVIEEGKIIYLMHVPDDGTNPKIVTSDIAGSLTESAIKVGVDNIGLFEPNISQKLELGVFGNKQVLLVKIEEQDMFGESSEVRWIPSDEFLNEGDITDKPIIKAANRMISRFILQLD